MALKTWIDDIKTAESGPESEAQLESVRAPAEGCLPGEKEADEILFAARDEIVKGGAFHFTQETKAAETEVNKTYKAMLDGGRDLAPLRDACARWIEAAGKTPDTPVIAGRK